MIGQHPRPWRNQGHAISGRAALVLLVGTAAVVAGIAVTAGIAASAPSRAIVESDRESPPRYVPPEKLLQLATESGDHGALGPVQRVGRSVPAGLSWTFLGPRPIQNEYWSGNADASGRVSAVIVDPRNPSVVYLAAAQGGVWKSLDDGVTWTPLTESLSSISSGALALDPSNPDVVYYGTGEQHYSIDCFYGDGLFRSPDGGASWSKIAPASTVGSYISRVAVSPADPNLIWIASDRGVVRSSDGGTSWTQVLSGDWATDMAVDLANPSILYAAISGHGIYKSVDGGQTFAQLGGGLPTSGFARINFGIFSSGTPVIYASFVSGGGGLYGMYRSDDGGTTWTQLVNTPNYLGGQGWYDNCVLVDPQNSSICYAAGVFPYGGGYAGLIKTTDAGASWTDITIGNDGTQLHPDLHALAFAPDGALWVGCDGGVWKTTDSGSHWLDRNHDLGVTQFYTAAFNPNNPDFLVGGNQDNGSVEYDGPSGWSQIETGDGGSCAVEWLDPSLYYSSYVQLSYLSKYDNGNYVGDVTGPWGGDRTDWCNSPLISDPNQAHTLLAGTYRVWRTTNSGSSWNLISGNLASGGDLRSLAVATGSSNTIYSGSSGGQVYVTTDGGANWSPRSTGLPAATIPSIVISPTSWQTAYLSADRANSDRVFKTTDAGQHWTSLTGDLVGGVRGMCLAVDFRTSPARLYLGTDYGVFVSTNSGAHWIKANASIPSVAVYNIWLDTTNNLLLAATHGRGMWRAPVDIVSPSVQVTSPVGGEQWAIGSTQDITWTANDAAGVDSLTIRLSRDGGNTFGEILAHGIPNSGDYTWTVTGPASNLCRVRVIATDPSGNVGSATSPANFAIENASDVPNAEGTLAFALHSPGANPSRPPVALRYDLPRAGDVHLAVYDPRGQLVARLFEGSAGKGSHEVVWTGRDDAGRAVPQGVYFCRLQAGDLVQSRRVLIIR